MVNPPKDVGPHEDLYREPFDQHIKQEATEFASWIRYLLTPETHDGPRLYVCHDCEKRLEYNYNEGWVGHNCEPGVGWHYRSSDTFELRSVLDGFEPIRFFQAAHALSNVWNNPPGQIGAAFEKLIDPFLLDPAAPSKRQEQGAEEDYPEARGESAANVKEAFAEVRNGLLDARRFPILTYHQRALAYAIGHENQMLAIAESLGRYRSIHREALNEVRILMAKMTERFARQAQIKSGDDDSTINFASAGIAAIVGAVTTVATGPVGGAAMVGILSALGSIATDVANGAKERPVPKGTWHDLAVDFLDEARRIGDAAHQAVTDLPSRVTSQLETIRATSVMIANGSGGSEDSRSETPRQKPPDVPML